MHANKLPNTLFPFVWQYLRRKKWCIAGFSVVALVYAIEMSLSPYLLKIIIDTIVQYTHNQNRMISAIMLPAILYALLTIIMNLNWRLYEYINLCVYPDLKESVNKNLYSYLLHHSHAYFQNAFTGNLTKKILDIGDNIELLIRIPNDWFLPNLLTVIIASTTLFHIVHPIFGIILIAWAILFITLSYFAARHAEDLARQFSESSAKMAGTVSDTIANVVSTKLFDTIPNELLHLDKNIEQVKLADRKFQWFNLKLNFVQEWGTTLLLSAMLIALIAGLKFRWVTAGDVALVLTLAISFSWSVHEVGKQLQSFFKIVGTCNQALTLLHTPHEIVDAPNAKPLQVKAGSIQFENVCFQYNPTQSLFTNLNITIHPNEKIGLVGYSGGGKSSFIKLILRLMDVQSGRILIDNQDVRLVTHSSLLQQMSMITQDPELFHRSIMENIRLAKIDASDSEVIEAAKKASCHAFISELPQQYQSMVGERGVKLSGGEKQRIAIARAFLKQSPILLLDEATSSLDSLTEQAIQDALRNLMTNKTTLIIAHRLATLKDVDRILVFDHGQIVEDGTLTTLLKNKKGLLYQLWQMQTSGFEFAARNDLKND